MNRNPQFQAHAEEFPMSKGTLWLLCIVLTPLFGAVMYYVWRGSHPEAANYANRASWASWGLWILLGVMLSRP